MGIFDLFKRKENPGTNLSTRITNVISASATESNFLNIHPDVVNLLWIDDGPRKNFYPSKNRVDVYRFEGFTISFTTIKPLEPSLIKTQLPIKKISDISKVPRPQYYPSYNQLEPDQRWIYWQLLSNPYDTTHDIGYVFLLYYGLERHLFLGSFEEAFRVILKLRDIHRNKSFQTYSARALILSCLYHQRPDMISEFMMSLDNEYEMIMPSNLYLLCKYSFDIPLNAEDIMRMAKDFEFKNTNYISKYPAIFRETLEQNISDKYSSPALEMKKLITQSEYNKARKEDLSIFANFSLSDKNVSIPVLIDLFKFKKAIFELLEASHSDVKSKLSSMKKEGTLPIPVSKITEKKQVEVFDPTVEKSLLDELKKAKGNPIKEHFALISLQDFYYKYRDLDSAYLNSCIQYCIQDITSLKSFVEAYKQEEITRFKRLIPTITKSEIAVEEKRIAELSFPGNVPAFKRLAIIYEKQGKYSEAIEICDKAICFGQISDGTDGGFKARKEKLISKLK